MSDYDAGVPAYPDARRRVEAETELVGLPEACPWTVKHVLDHGLWATDDAST
jgi:Domain of unknown function DUF29